MAAYTKISDIFSNVDGDSTDFAHSASSEFMRKLNKTETVVPVDVLPASTVALAFAVIIVVIIVIVSVDVLLCYAIKLERLRKAKRKPAEVRSHGSFDNIAENIEMSSNPYGANPSDAVPNIAELYNSTDPSCNYQIEERPQYLSSEDGSNSHLYQAVQTDHMTTNHRDASECASFEPTEIPIYDEIPAEQKTQNITTLGNQREERPQDLASKYDSDLHLYQALQKDQMSANQPNVSVYMDLKPTEVLYDEVPAELKKEEKNLHGTN